MCLRIWQLRIRLCLTSSCVAEFSKPFKLCDGQTNGKLALPADQLVLIESAKSTRLTRSQAPYGILMSRKNIGTFAAAYSSRGETNRQRLQSPDAGKAAPGHVPSDPRILEAPRDEMKSFFHLVSR